MRISFHYIRLGLLSQFIILGLLSACQHFASAPVREFVGFAGATDERTAAVGEKILLNKGNAADAAVAMLLHQAVVLPSRAGLGSGGICQILDAENNQVKTLTFLPKKTSATVGVPALPKGAFALQTRYGQWRWSDVVQPAYEAANAPQEVSALVKKDTEAYQDSVFNQSMLVQPRLADTLQQLMQNGSGVFYKGELGKAIVEEHENQLNEQHYQTYAASWTDSIHVDLAEGRAYFPNTAAVGRAAPDLWQWAHDNAEQSAPDGMGDMPMFADQEMKSASVMAVDASGMVVVCSVSQGSALGSQLFSQAGGFYLPEPIDSLQEQLFNALWTQPGSTKITYVMSLLGERALVAGVRLAQQVVQKGEKLEESVKATQSVVTFADLADVPLLACGAEGAAEPTLCQRQATRLIVK